MRSGASTVTMLSQSLTESRADLPPRGTWPPAGVERQPAWHRDQRWRSVATQPSASAGSLRRKGCPPSSEMARPSKTASVAKGPLGRVSPTVQTFVAHGQAEASRHFEACLAVPPVFRRTLLALVLIGWKASTTGGVMRRQESHLGRRATRRVAPWAGRTLGAHTRIAAPERAGATQLPQPSWSSCCYHSDGMPPRTKRNEPR